MFFLAEFKDVIRTLPDDFRRDQAEAINDELNSRLANKVVKDVGLCICLFDIIHVGDPYIYPGDGSTHTQVKFRYVVFRPFIGEVLSGRIKSCTDQGLHVSMGFFEDIVIPAENLQKDTVFDPEERLWMWKYGEYELWMDLDEPIRFRVERESFIDAPALSDPSQPEAAPVMPATADEQMQIDVERQKVAPYTLTGSVDGPGLGLLAWWRGQ